jgi:N-carbamoyl-L-amino-acid hydrolase
MMEIAKIGETKKGGVCRVALTDEDKDGRNLFIKWCKEANCTIRIDAMGSIFARREGANPNAKSILIGSHLDSQPTGGKFDGVYGVLAALEVVETLNDHKIVTKHPIEIVSWTNEEGARFSPAMVASGVFANEFTLDYAYARKDASGKTLGEELDRIGFKGTDIVIPDIFEASIEVHIEQGPILEAEEKSIGVVTGVQGIKWYDVIIHGKETHAGPSPMSYRQDPIKYSNGIIHDLYKMVDDFAPNGRLTIGYLNAVPGVRNTVPGIVTIAVDLRHPDEEMLTKMDENLQSIVEKHRSIHNFQAEISPIWHSPSVVFAETCVNAVRKSVKKLNIPFMEMVSGAGHDSVYVSKVIPTSMIFIPCKDGLSHNELESAKKQDVINGTNVLLHAVLEL